MKPVGPYTPIRQAGNLFFVSGQIGIEPDSQNMVDGIEAQTQQVMNNLAAVLAEAGLSVAFAVSDLPKDALVEIEAIAYKN